MQHRTDRYVNGTRERHMEEKRNIERKKDNDREKKRERVKEKSKRKTRISTIHSPSFPACTILRPLQAASVSMFGTTH